MAHNARAAAAISGSLAKPDAVRVHATSWRPSDARVTLNLTLDACVVPSSEGRGSCRVDKAHVVCLDEFLDGDCCDAILARLTGGAAQAGTGATPPQALWERRTADAPDKPCTWGLKDAAMRALEKEPPAAVVELQSRLSLLYPEFVVAHQPDLSPSPGADVDASAGVDADSGAGTAAVCERFVANAATAGDVFSWHVDADPSALPHGAWTAEHGHYINREVAKPLFVSCLLYLDASWPHDHDAETLFLDPPTGTGIFVRPRRGRVVLMDGDVTHRVSAPSTRAGRPRYSLVWKLVFFPRNLHERPSIARPEWGRPAAFGSAARLDAVMRALPATTSSAPQDAPHAAPVRESEAPAGCTHAPADDASAPVRVKRARKEATPLDKPAAKRAAGLGAPQRGAKRSSREPDEVTAAEPPRKTHNVADMMET